MKSGSTLTTAADFNTAFLQGLNVIVWQDESIVQYGSQIERHIKDAVKINGTYYVKSHHEFRVK